MSTLQLATATLPLGLIVNKRNKKRYPELVIRLLELFDYEVEFKAVYKIRKLKPDDSNNVE